MVNQNRKVAKMKFKTGNLVDGKRDEGVIVEYPSWFLALDAILSLAGVYLYEMDEEGNEVV